MKRFMIFTFFVFVIPALAILFFWDMGAKKICQSAIGEAKFNRFSTAIEKAKNTVKLANSSMKTQKVMLDELTNGDQSTQEVTPPKKYTAVDYFSRAQLFESNESWTKAYLNYEKVTEIDPCSDLANKAKKKMQKLDCKIDKSQLLK